MRLKHLYLAIATLSFQMIFQWVINFMSFFNQGQTIFVGRVRWFTGTVSREGHYLFWYYVMLVVVMLCGYAVRNLLRTRYGRCLVAVRDNDRAADAMGMHPGLTKVYAFALAGFFAGRGRRAARLRLPRGGVRVVHPAPLDHLPGDGDRRRAGDAGRVLPRPGGDHAARPGGGGPVEDAGTVLAGAKNLATALKPLAFGTVIVLFLMFEPRGIANWWRIARSYLKLWPFRY